MAPVQLQEKEEVGATDPPPADQGPGGEAWLSHITWLLIPLKVPRMLLRKDFVWDTLNSLACSHKVSATLSRLVYPMTNTKSYIGPFEWL